jgi:hypothetical protein
LRDGKKVAAVFNRHAKTIKKKGLAVKNCESEMVILFPPCRCALLPLRFHHRSYKISKNAPIYNLLRYLLDAC